MSGTLLAQPQLDSVGELGLQAENSVGSSPESCSFLNSPTLSLSGEGLIHCQVPFLRVIVNKLVKVV